MKILMLGWEYPPLISGGLATASEGLTRALAAQGVNIDFVLPRLCGREQAGHMAIYACHELRNSALSSPSGSSSQLEGASSAPGSGSAQAGSLGTNGAWFSSYTRPQFSSTIRTRDASPVGTPESTASANPAAQSAERPDPVGLMRELIGYSHDDPFLREVCHYTQAVAQASRDRKVDLIHAHDWMTFPAGILLSKSMGVPLVVHVHSLEYDRCGDGGSPLIHAIEYAGVHHAEKVIAVSNYTREMICQKLGVPHERVSVAYNGVKPAERAPEPVSPEVAVTPVAPQKPTAPISRVALPVPPAVPAPTPKRKRVLFLGRVTYQKGPDLFVEAAALVLQHYRDVVFVLAGSGDMLSGVKERARQLGIADYFEFPGFVSGRRLEEEFSRADLYVMPSISEPFGIAPLEALARGTPALITKQSGVSEVLSHVLKSDFWDVRKMADFILNSLLHPELGRSLMAMSRGEVQRLKWDEAARSVIHTYHDVLSESRLREVS